jgi:hypothetical protein
MHNPGGIGVDFLALRGILHLLPEHFVFDDVPLVDEGYLSTVKTAD